MAASSGGSSSLLPPCPKSPPEYPDLYGKRKETAKVQMLEREITYLQVELKSVEGLQPASRCCKEVTDFVTANSDPLIPTSQKNRKSCRFWKWLCGMPFFNLSWICCCCYSSCSCHLKCPPCCDCNLCNCCSCVCRSCNCDSCNCSSCTCGSCDCSSCKCYSFNCNSCLSCCTIPKWRCCSCPKSDSCRKISCNQNCCMFPFPSCAGCCCCRWKCSRPKCPKSLQTVRVADGPFPGSELNNGPPT